MLPVQSKLATPHQQAIHIHTQKREEKNCRPHTIWSLHASKFIVLFMSHRYCRLIVFSGAKLCVCLLLLLLLLMVKFHANNFILIKWHATKQNKTKMKLHGPHNVLWAIVVQFFYPLYFWVYQVNLVLTYKFILVTHIRKLKKNQTILSMM